MDIIQQICTALSDIPPYMNNSSPEYKQLFMEYSETVDYLSHTLTQTQRKLFLELEAQRNLLGGMDEDMRFCCGFRCGAKLMPDILTSPHD